MQSQTQDAVVEVKEGDTGTCRWEECRQPIKAKVFHRVDGDDYLAWVHDDGRELRNCTTWTPVAEPL